MAQNVKCKNCNGLKNHWCEAVIDSPDEDMIRDCKHFRQKTNADRIRAMTDEELREFMCSITNCRVCPHEKWTGCGMLDWLKQPAEESDGK